MNQNLNRPRSSRFCFNFFDPMTIIAIAILIVVIIVAWLSQINPRGDVFWGGVRLLFYIALGTIFTILITAHFTRAKKPLWFGRILLSLFLSATFFYLCIQLASFLGYSSNNFLISTKQNKVERNIKQIVTLKHFSLTNRELFNANNFFIKTEKEKQIQYYYLNDLSKLVEIKSLQNKDISMSGQLPILSPLKEKIAIPIGNQLYIYDKNQNDSWVISVDANSYNNGLHFRNFFFNKDEELIFSVDDYKLGDFSIDGGVDFKSNSIGLSVSKELGQIIYPENQKNDACENIDEIDMQSFSHQSLPNNNCLYVTSSYNEQRRDYIHTLKLYNTSSKNKNILLEGDYINIDLINILYISI